MTDADYVCEMAIRPLPDGVDVRFSRRRRPGGNRTRRTLAMLIVLPIVAYAVIANSATHDLLKQRLAVMGLAVATGAIVVSLVSHRSLAGCGVLRAIVSGDTLQLRGRRLQRSQIEGVGVGSPKQQTFREKTFRLNVVPRHEPLIEPPVDIPAADAQAIVTTLREALRLPPLRAWRAAWLQRQAELTAPAATPAAPFAEGPAVLEYAPAVREGNRFKPVIFGTPERFVIIVLTPGFLAPGQRRIDLTADTITIVEGDDHRELRCDDIVSMSEYLLDDQTATELTLVDGSRFAIGVNPHMSKLDALLRDFLNLPRPTWERRERNWPEDVAASTTSWTPD